MTWRHRAEMALIGLIVVLWAVSLTLFTLLEIVLAPVLWPLCWALDWHFARVSRRNAILALISGGTYVGHPSGDGQEP